MLVTEEEAKKRWCPFVRALEGEPPGAAGVNRSGPATSYDCIASECMAWRKQESAAFALKANAEFERTGAILESTEGFCGLAGKP